MYVALACLLCIVLIVGWGLNLFGLPGNWVNVAATVAYALIVPSDHRVWVSWWVVAAVIGMAVIGEVVEGAAGAAGAAKAGGSRRGMVLGVLGSFIGGIIGAIVGLPIPVIGSVIAILLFACGGALGGAMLGEWWKGRDLQTSWEIGQAAFWGRLFGTLGKITMGTAIMLIVFAALLVK